ncbi:MAG: GAF domain-containing protein [Leptolyngbya sp. LCM1.Bin17]|nr:MAG: GAF domain-containing protein [Leptolyngbya sp. LCM1.Bin17]
MLLPILTSRRSLTPMAQSYPTDPPYDQQMMSLSRILKALRGAITAAEAITLALDHVHQELDFEVAWLGLYDRINHRLLTKGCHSPKQMRSIRTIVNLTPGDVMEQAVVQLRPLIVADLQNEIRAGEWGAIAKQLALQSAIIFPIKRQEVCFGLLLLASPAWGKTASLGERSYLAIVTGGLAEVLHHFEAEQQRQQAKRLEQPLLNLLGKFGQLPDTDSQIRDLVHETQRFIAPTRTRVFWFEPKGNYFWQRWPGHSTAITEAGAKTLRIAVEEVRGLYQALANQQLVVVGESRGAHKAIVPDRLMQQLKAQSLMVAPITRQGDVVGFLAVEGTAPRIWQPGEKQFLLGAAQLLSLAMPLAANQDLVRQVKLDQHLTTGMIQGIYGDVDWHQTLNHCFQVLRDRLGVQQFLVLLFNPDRNGYDLCFQSQASRPRSVPMLWPCLDDVDWQMLERSPAAISIDNLAQDLKLMAWRPYLLDLGTQAVLAGNVAPGNAPEGIVMIGDRISRQWTAEERGLFESMARQIGVILHQWQLQRQLDQQQHIYESLQWGLQALHQGFQPEQLEQTTLRHILQLLQGAMVLLVSWQPGDSVATVSQVINQDSSMEVDPHYPIPVGSDALLNWAMQTDGVLPIQAADLPEQTQAWFQVPASCRLLVAALKTAPIHWVTGVVVAVSPAHRQWGSHHSTIFKLLTGQMAWSRRHLAATNMLTQQRQDLEQLNWYKHHCLDGIYDQLAQISQTLEDLQDRQAPHPPDQLGPDQLGPLHSQIQALMTDARQVLDQERWQLQQAYQTTPLISLLNRLMERVKPVFERRQLWSKVHHDSNAILGGDLAKIELMLYDVMTAACDRSPIGGRIDVWCRGLTADWLELSITDDGHCPPGLLEELNQGQPMDVLAPSSLDEPPGLHLAICKGLIDQLGGEISFSTLDDGRTHSRVLLPLATYSEHKKHRNTINSPLNEADQPSHLTKD